MNLHFKPGNLFQTLNIQQKPTDSLLMSLQQQIFKKLNYFKKRRYVQVDFSNYLTSEK